MPSFLQTRQGKAFIVAIIAILALVFWFFFLRGGEEPKVVQPEPTATSVPTRVPTQVPDCLTEKRALEGMQIWTEREQSSQIRRPQRTSFEIHSTSDIESVTVTYDTSSDCELTVERKNREGIPQPGGPLTYFPKQSAFGGLFPAVDLECEGERGPDCSLELAPEREPRVIWVHKKGTTPWEEVDLREVLQ